MEDTRSKIPVPPVVVQQPREPYRILDLARQWLRTRGGRLMEQQRCADQRDVRANERDARADRRDVRADERDARADRRDVRADERDARGDRRDVRADERDVAFAKLVPATRQAAAAAPDNMWVQTVSEKIEKGDQFWKAAEIIIGSPQRAADNLASVKLGFGLIFSFAAAMGYGKKVAEGWEKVAAGGSEPDDRSEPW